ncbi:MAG TPA: metal-dependent transcriptional regulator [Acidobacteriaceae bacterium]|nr:metal-dependent transcriptional regulator [Acidobacteriaceae bacterium]
MAESITVSKEDYLKAILEAESEGYTVIPATLAHWLSVSAPAVTNALKRLKRDGFVEFKSGAIQSDSLKSDSLKSDGQKSAGIVRLTPLGKETAYRTALRHHLIERMLSEIFGMEWYEIHAEAERLEHAVSPAFEARLIEKLGEEGMCPHGNTVLPESPARRRKRGLIPLSEGESGGEYQVMSLYERDPKLLIFLHQSGINPNARLRLIARNYDQTVSVETPSGSITLGHPAAERVWVRRVDSGKNAAARGAF